MGGNFEGGASDGGKKPSPSPKSKSNGRKTTPQDHEYFAHGVPVGCVLSSVVLSCVSCDYCLIVERRRRMWDAA